MKKVESNRQNKLWLLEVLVLAQLGIVSVWFWKLSIMTTIDNSAIFPFQIFGWSASIGIFSFAFIHLKQLSNRLLKVLRLLFAFFPLVLIYFTDKIAGEYPHQYRFTICNLTGSTLEKVTIQNYDQVSCENLHINQCSSLSLYYQEGTEFYLITNRMGKTDTVPLSIGGTNSVGYIYNLGIKFKDEKILAVLEH